MQIYMNIIFNNHKNKTKIKKIRRKNIKTYYYVSNEHRTPTMFITDVVVRFYICVLQPSHSFDVRMERVRVRWLLFHSYLARTVYSTVRTSETPIGASIRGVEVLLALKRADRGLARKYINILIICPVSGPVNYLIESIRNRINQICEKIWSEPKIFPDFSRMID